MRSLVKIIALSFIICLALPARNGFAFFLRFDVAAIGGELFDTITNIKKQAQEKVEESGVKKMIKNYGKGAQTYKARFDEKLADVRATQRGLAEQKSELDKAKDLQKERNRIKKEIKTLEEERDAIEKVYASDIEILVNQAAAERERIERNNTVYQELLQDETLSEAERQSYLDIIAENNKRKAGIGEEFTRQKDEATRIKDEKIEKINAKIKALERELRELNYSTGKNIAADLFKKEKTDTGEVNEETANRLFLRKDEVVSVENINMLRHRRNKEALDHNVDAIAQSLQIKIKTGGSEDLAQHIQRNVSLLDGLNDATSQRTMAKIEQMQVIIDLIRLKTLALKAETSTEMAKTTVYTREDYEGDQSVIDLHNYKPSDEQKAAAQRRAKVFFGVPE